jgi:hypothetical protein
MKIKRIITSVTGLRSAVLKGPNSIGVSLPSPEEGNK